MWIPPEDMDPIVLHAPTRKGVSVFGAVQISTGKLVTMITPKYNAITFQTFLQSLVDNHFNGLPMHIILDNSRYHHAKLLLPWKEERNQQIEFDFLPPYCPDLNPIERVWKLIRRLRVHNHYFPTIDDLIHTLTEQFKLWEKPNQTIYKLCQIT